MFVVCCCDWLFCFVLLGFGGLFELVSIGVSCLFTVYGLGCVLGLLGSIRLCMSD